MEKFSEKNFVFVCSERYLTSLLTHYTLLIAHYRVMQKNLKARDPEDAYIEICESRIHELVQSKTQILNRIKKQKDQIKKELRHESEL